MPNTFVAINVCNCFAWTYKNCRDLLHAQISCSIVLVLLFFLIRFEFFVSFICKWIINTKLESIIHANNIVKILRWWNNKNIKGTTNKIYVFRIYKCVINKCNILTYLQVLSCFNHSLWCTTPNTNSCRWNSLKESHNTNCMEEIYLKQLIVRKILLCIYLLYWNCCIVKLFQVSKWCIIL